MGALLTTAFLLTLGLGDDDESARQLFKDFRSKLEKASTLEVAYTLTYAENFSILWSLRGEVKVAERGRWTVDLKYRTQHPPGTSVSHRTQLYHDGDRITVGSLPEGMNPDTLQPDGIERKSRAGIGTTLVPFLSLARPPQGAGGDTGLGQPAVENVRDGGTASKGDRTLRVIRYDLTFKSDDIPKYSARLHLDPERMVPVQRILTSPRSMVVETFRSFHANRDLSSTDFSFQTKARLSRARAAQVIRAITLYARFTGRNPESLGDLLERPAHLEPDVFWPEGGFLSSRIIPKDAWNHPFELTTEEGKLVLIGRGEDGKEGGVGRDADIALSVPNPSYRALGAPTARLRRVYQARVELHRIASAVRGYYETYGRLPGSISELWEKPKSVRLWPDGGWIASQAAPLDPWDKPYLLVGDRDRFTLQVGDPEGTLLLPSELTQDERRSLERTAVARLPKASVATLDGLIESLGSDVPMRRERAEHHLREWGPKAREVLLERAKKAVDPEVTLRLTAILDHVREPLSKPWQDVLGPLTLTVAVGSSIGHASLEECEARLNRLYQAMKTYTEKFGGDERMFPSETGHTFWRVLSKTRPPLVSPDSADLFRCPSDETYSEKSLYWGPKVDANRPLSYNYHIGLCEAPAHGDFVVVMHRAGQVHSVSRGGVEHHDALRTTRR